MGLGPKNYGGHLFVPHFTDFICKYITRYIYCQFYVFVLTLGPRNDISYINITAYFYYKKKSGRQFRQYGRRLKGVRGWLSSGTDENDEPREQGEGEGEGEGEREGWMSGFPQDRRNRADEGRGRAGKGDGEGVFPTPIGNLKISDAIRRNYCN